jgi:hypothetical protein
MLTAELEETLPFIGNSFQEISSQAGVMPISANFGSIFRHAVGDKKRQGQCPCL